VGEALNRDLRAGLVTARFPNVCADKATPRWLDERRILGCAGEIVLDQPALPRWHPGLAAAPRQFVQVAQRRQ